MKSLILVVSFLISPVISFTVNADDSLPLPKKAEALTTQEQIGQAAAEYLAAHPEKIGESVAIYLAEHPEFLVAAQENLHQRQAQIQQQTLTQQIARYHKELLDQDSPSTGPLNAQTAVVVFFDYQCAYCSKMAPVIKTLIQTNPDVRFIFREFPVLAARWPVSAFAARTGEKIWKEKGKTAYLAYHDALFATGHTEGTLTVADVRTAAAPYLNKDVLAVLEQADTTDPTSSALGSTRQLAQKLGLTSTPVFVVLPQSQTQALPQRISVFPGEATQDALQAAITHANEK
ncbi:thioredoxin domain-containing protein [Klebsiella aerogenes]|uniref:thioredoxin domain-containing protein n=1 Tax=Klebsiella aerogenes TaxID=548 RepID=UPI001F33E0E0|nr:thioredoxin domain-containing protein [Klebsiella aerogenes]